MTQMEGNTPRVLDVLYQKSKRAAFLVLAVPTIITISLVSEGRDVVKQKLANSGSIGKLLLAFWEEK